MRASLNVFAGLHRTCWSILYSANFAGAITSVTSSWSPQMSETAGMDSQPTERQQWDALVTELDKELLIFGPIRHELGRILYSIKAHLRKHGLDKSRIGRWEAMLRERKLEKSTARDWVVKYQQAEGIPLEQCFFPRETLRVKKTRKSHRYRENNRAGTALIESDARIDVAPDEKKDDSPKGRLAVECIFVLTYEEKLRFVEAVRSLGPLRATQLMYKAVVTDDAAEHANAAGV